MNDSNQTKQGFDPHVMDQLQQIAATPSPNSRGRNTRRRGKQQYQKFDYESRQDVPPQQGMFVIPGTVPVPSNNVNYRPNQQSNMNSFPPLGSVEPIQKQNQPPGPQHLQQPYLEHSSQSHQVNLWQTHSPSEFPGRGYSNGHRGGRSQGGGPARTNFEARSSFGVTDHFQRPRPQQNRLFQPGGNPFFGTSEQQRAFRHKTMLQSDFLGSIADRALQNQISQEEYHEKESFRKVIEGIAQKTILENLSPVHDFRIDNVKLKVYGSLGSGFGVTGSDMDLLLTFPQSEGSSNGVEIEARRWLEKALLEAGFGARLLTNTRVPILKVCQKPSADLLTNLREHRRQWDDSLETHPETEVTTIQEAPLPPTLLATAALAEALQEILLDAVQVPLPDASQAEQAKLDFEGDCGIQCDINFTNYVALRNTELLRIYGVCDPRVRQVGLFVKHWAKARDINTPYKGTLSSYGYIMLVLHYLMNVVTPPVLPNLQAIAKDQDEWEGKTEIETVEGFDVRYIRDPDQLRHIMASIKPNHESLGSLLRGFYWYYACNEGFHWTRDVVSIRTRGGQVTKQSKGWTGAKWSESKQNVRLRYLLAIEDPFETEHNIGRTVGHSGIVAIRDEFRRAWSIIANVQLNQAEGIWLWTPGNGEENRNAEEFMEIVQNRGDLLRKDQVAYKDRMRQMRKEAEVKEQALQNAKSDEGDTDHENARNIAVAG